MRRIIYPMAKPNPSGGPNPSLTAVKGRPLSMALDSFVVERRDHIRRAAIVRRIAAEFLEMPGLVLSTRQASRLLGLDEAACGRILSSLVDDGILRRRGRDSYGRSDAGA
jgi:hypothetical protein